MLKISQNVLFAAAMIVLTGCSDNQPRRVTDGVDLDAIRQYEEDHKSIQAENAAASIEEQPVEEE